MKLLLSVVLTTVLMPFAACSNSTNPSADTKSNESQTHATYNSETGMWNVECSNKTPDHSLSNELYAKYVGSDALCEPFIYVCELKISDIFTLESKDLVGFLLARSGTDSCLEAWGFWKSQERLEIDAQVGPNLAVLSNFKALKRLRLTRSHIVDISPLSEMRELEYLNLERNNIVDISPLLQISSLVEVNLAENRISDLRSLGGSLLKTLQISDNLIEDLDVLPNSIEVLLANDNAIKEVESIDNFNNLKTLELNSNKIEEVDFRGWPLLEEFEARKNRIEELSHLDALNSIKRLRLESNRLESSDLNGIDALATLERLELQDNDIDDVSILRTLSFDTLTLSGNPIAKSEDSCPIGDSVNPVLSSFCRNYIAAE